MDIANASTGLYSLSPASARITTLDLHNSPESSIIPVSQLMKVKVRRTRPAVSAVLQLELKSPAWPITCSLLCAQFASYMMPPSFSALVTKNGWWLRSDLCLCKMVSTRKCGLGCVPATKTLSCPYLVLQWTWAHRLEHTSQLCSEGPQFTGMVTGPRTHGRTESGNAQSHKSQQDSSGPLMCRHGLGIPNRWCSVQPAFPTLAETRGCIAPEHVVLD